MLLLLLQLLLRCATRMCGCVRMLDVPNESHRMCCCAKTFHWCPSTLTASPVLPVRCLSSGTFKCQMRRFGVLLCVCLHTNKHKLHIGASLSLHTLANSGPNHAACPGDTQYKISPNLLNSATAQSSHHSRRPNLVDNTNRHIRTLRRRMCKARRRRRRSECHTTGEQPG